VKVNCNASTLNIPFPWNLASANSVLVRTRWLRPGWPDWANFCELFTLGSFLKITEVAQTLLGYFYRGKNYVYTKIGWATFFHKLVWSPWLKPMHVVEATLTAGIRQRLWKETLHCGCKRLHFSLFFDNFTYFLFFRNTTLYPSGIRSHDHHGSISSVAGGDDTNRPLRQGTTFSFLFRSKSPRVINKKGFGGGIVSSWVIGSNPARV
jgi:hypothetical protein